jgi:hypothetical protein
LRYYCSCLVYFQYVHNKPRVLTQKSLKGDVHDRTDKCGNNIKLQPVLIKQECGHYIEMRVILTALLLVAHANNLHQCLTQDLHDTGVPIGIQRMSSYCIINNLSYLLPILTCYHFNFILMKTTLLKTDDIHVTCVGHNLRVSVARLSFLSLVYKQYFIHTQKHTSYK